MVEETVIKKWIVIAIIVSLFVLAFLVVQPIMIPIIFGVLGAYIFSPIFKFINRFIKIKTISAFILMILILFLLAFPIVYWTPSIVKQTFEVYNQLQTYDFVEVLSEFVSEDFAKSISSNIDNIISRSFSLFLNQFTDVLVNLPSLMLKFAVFLFTFFFAIRDADNLKKYFSGLSPFSESTEKRFLNEFRGITNSIIYGQVLVGILQGLVLGAAFYFLEVPKALTLTFIASIVSMIPLLGPVIVWLPVGGLMLATGNTFEGVFILLYGGLFVSSLDNIIRPYILSRNSNLHIAMSIIGIVGGMYLFGILGLVLGPLILAYVLIIIEFYREGKLDDLFKKK